MWSHENWISRCVWPYRQSMAAKVITGVVVLQVLSGRTHLTDTFVHLARIGWPVPSAISMLRSYRAYHALFIVYWSLARYYSMHRIVDQRLRPRGGFPFRRTPPLPSCARHLVSRLRKYPIKGCGAAFRERNGRTFMPHPRYIRVTESESGIALSYWTSCALILDKPAWCK